MSIRTPRWFQLLARFPKRWWRRLKQEDCPSAAGMLSYFSLLAVVPLATVALAVMSSFSVFDNWAGKIEAFVFRNFVPAASDTVQEYINQFSSQASDLPALGIAFLLVTALLLMSTVEREFNRIWRVGTARSVVSKFVVYWTALTVGPLAVSVSLILSSYFFSLPFIRGAAERPGLALLLLRSIPFLLALAGFFLTYLIVPNRSVPWRCAAGGALLAAVLFEAAKFGFAVYVTTVPTYEAIYGTLAVLPIFLLWVYVSWFVILLGASFSAALSDYSVASGAGWAESRRFALLYRLVGHLWQAQRSGSGLTTRRLQQLEPAASQDQVSGLVNGLHGAGILTRSERGAWFLSRDAQELTLLDLYRSGAFSLLSSSAAQESDSWNLRLAEVLDSLGDEVEAGLSHSVRDLYLDPSAPAKTPEKSMAPRQAVPEQAVAETVVSETIVSDDTAAEEAQNVG